MPFDIPSLPSSFTDILSQVNNIFSSSIGFVKTILPWSYLSILLKLVLVFELGHFSYRFFILIYKFLSSVCLKIIEFTSSLVSKIGSLFSSIFGL